MRPNRCTDDSRDGRIIPGQITVDKIRRPRNREAIRVFNKQLRPTRLDHRPALQIALAGRAVLQMDQAAPVHQGFFRHFGERRQNTSMDCDLGLRTRGDYQKTPQPDAEPLHNFTDFERDHI